MAEEKIEEKKEQFKILSDPEYKKSLGLVTIEATCEHLGISKPIYYKNLEEWKKENGAKDYNSDNYLEESNSVVDKALIKACQKGVPSALLTYFKRTGKITEKREDTVKVEFTVADRLREAARLRDDLYAEYRDTGVCSICHQRKEVHVQSRLDNGREQQSEDTVAAVALSARPA